MRHLLWLPLLAACHSSTVLDLTSSKPDRTPEAEQKYKEAVERREVKLGMTKSEVKAAIGSPRRSGKTTYRGERVTFWAYLYTDIYFDGKGLVVGWHSAVG